MSPENMIFLLAGVLLSGLISAIAFFMVWRRKFNQLAQQRKTEAFYLDRVTDLLEKADLSKKEDAHARIFALALSEQTDRLIAGAVSDKEKALRIAEWIGTRWRNVSSIESVFESHEGPDRCLNFLYRTGACGIRSVLFVHMAELAGLRARRFSIFKFGRVGTGHTAVQVFWDGGWHFFDVTYSGYFEKEGHILSFEEMRAEREALALYATIFQNADCYNRRHPSKWAWIDNKERMLRIYEPENLAKAEAFGFIGDPTPVRLRYSMEPGETLGDGNGDWRGVFRDERRYQKSEQLEFIGFRNVNVWQSVRLTGMKPGNTYRYVVSICDYLLSNKETFTATVSGGEVTSGATFSPSKTSKLWTIVIVPQADVCDLLISHDIEKFDSGIWVDQISFAPVVAGAVPA